MNEHSVTNGEHDGPSATELRVPGAERSGLDRRQLLTGLVAGATGLLLPRPAAVHAQTVFGIKRIRFEVFNRGWGDNVVLEAYWPGYASDKHLTESPTWEKQEITTLNEGKDTAFEGHSLVAGKINDLPFEPQFRVVANGAGVWATNPVVGLPQAAFLFGSFDKTDLKIGQSITRQVPGSNRDIKVTRKDDTKDFKVFVVELRKIGESAPFKGKQEKQDKKDNSKRPRKRGGGGGLRDIDRRKRPVDRLLD